MLCRDLNAAHETTGVLTLPTVYEPATPIEGLAGVQSNESKTHVGLVRLRIE